MQSLREKLTRLYNSNTHVLRKRLEGFQFDGALNAIKSKHDRTDEVYGKATNALFGPLATANDENEKIHSNLTGNHTLPICV